MLLSALLDQTQPKTRAAIRADVEIAGLTTDSRAVQAGYLFAALPGVKHHGIDFVGEALDRGAVAVLTELGVAPDKTSPPVWIEDDNPARRLAQCAARFYAPLPSRVLGVTGTDGKSSIAFLAQALIEKVAGATKSQEALRAGYVGTLGLLPDFGLFATRPILTTPDAITLAQHLSALHKAGYDCVLLETSSHGLAQHRPDGLLFRAACFTGLGRDHLEYHKTSTQYLAAKQRLFTELLAEDGVAILCAGRTGSDAIKAALNTERKKSRCLSYGFAADPVRAYALTSFCHKADGAEVGFSLKGQAHTYTLPLFTPFQAENLLAASLMACQALDGVAVSALLDLAEDLPSVPGRMERFKGAGEIFVDYAHAPQAVEATLKALRARLQALSGGRLLVVLGAGGDRDAGKRPAMGKAAADYADAIFVTDDNPRSEDANAIRESVLAGASGREVFNIQEGRRAAIERAVAKLKAGDILAILGKGHEATQEINGQFFALDDRAVVRELLQVAGKPR